MSFLDIFKTSQFKSEIEQLKQQNQALQEKLNALCYDDYDSAQKTIADLKTKAEQEKSQIAFYEEQKVKVETQFNERKDYFDSEFKKFESDIAEKRTTLSTEIETTEKKLKTAVNKLSKSKELYRSIQHAMKRYFEYVPEIDDLLLSNSQLEELENLSPSVILKLHYMDVKSLKKAFRDNDKQIEKVLLQYQGRYTTKANKAIYDLMVIALRAELQNILYNLKFQKLDDGIEQVKEITKKYLEVATNGNQSIAGTLTKFIGEIEYLFMNAVKIEYNYYVKKEQARQEQLAIREQMKQEEEERKA